MRQQKKQEILLTVFVLTDYKKYVESHPDDNIFQYDSVEGKIDDKKAILTITYPEFRF